MRMTPLEQLDNYSITQEMADEARECHAEFKRLDTKISKLAATELLMRVHLGLSPIHDLTTMVRVLHDDGREAFEKLRGARCEHAHEWKP